MDMSDMHALQESITRLTDAMELIEIVDEDIEEFKDTMQERDTGLCVMCPCDALFRDVLNIPWCSEHQERGEFVNLMSTRRFQEVIHADIEGEEARYSIGSGAYFTANFALSANDECITALALAALAREKAA